MPKTLVVKENNMSSPFSKKFMDKKSSLFMTQKQEKTFGPEGTNPNPEIYEAIKKNDGDTTNSPLEYSAPAVGYVSTRESLQNMFDNISSAADKTLKALADPQVQANRLEDRIERRKQRADKATKKSEELLGITRTKVIDPKTGKQEVKTTVNPYKNITKKERKKSKRLRERATRLESKEEKLKARKTKYQEKADRDYNKKLQQMEDLYSLKNPSEIDFGLRLNEGERIYNENKKDTDPKWEDLDIFNKTQFVTQGKIYPRT